VPVDRKATRQVLFYRLGHERAERGNPYSMMSLFEMAQASLVDLGISVSGFGSRSQIVNLAFTHFPAVDENRFSIQLP
jgi:hypothetical protein